MVPLKYSVEFLLVNPNLPLKALCAFPALAYQNAYAVVYGGIKITKGGSHHGIYVSWRT